MIAFGLVKGSSSELIADQPEISLHASYLGAFVPEALGHINEKHVLPCLSES